MRFGYRKGADRCAKCYPAYTYSEDNSLSDYNAFQGFSWEALRCSRVVVWSCPGLSSPESPVDVGEDNVLSAHGSNHTRLIKAFRVPHGRLRAGMLDIGYPVDLANSATM
jgi:hypothetical protein